jgi:hypothetical protein
MSSLSPHTFTDSDHHVLDRASREWWKLGWDCLDFTLSHMRWVRGREGIEVWSTARGIDVFHVIDGSRTTLRPGGFRAGKAHEILKVLAPVLHAPTSSIAPTSSRRGSLR